LNLSVDDWKAYPPPARRRSPVCLGGRAADRRADQAIKTIRGLCASNDCLYPDNVSLGGRGTAIVHAVPFEVGAAARLLDGPMADMTGI
jgi:hypothetical protein